MTDDPTTDVPVAADVAPTDVTDAVDVAPITAVAVEQTDVLLSDDERRQRGFDVAAYGLESAIERATARETGRQ